MTTSTFRETVALVAARAHERLPAAVNGRIALAVKLVLGHDVEPQADGSILVGSSTDPMRQYRLEGATCTCSDFAHGKGIEGWCQHRIAAGIDKRVRELLPVEVPVEPWSDNDIEGPLPELEPDPDHEEVEMPPTPLPEAALSLTLKGTLGGIEAMLTIRGQSAAEFQRNLAAIRGLLDPPAQAPQVPAVQGQGWCAVHHVQMQQHTNAKGSWFSHFIDGRHCKGR
jgi:hypothetical protein